MVGMDWLSNWGIESLPVAVAAGRRIESSIAVGEEEGQSSW